VTSARTLAIDASNDTTSRPIQNHRRCSRWATFRLLPVQSPPIDAIRLIFAEEVARGGGDVSAVYDVGGLLYLRATLTGRAGELTACVALRVVEDLAEVRSGVMWGDGGSSGCALVDGRSVALEDPHALVMIREAVRLSAEPAAFDDVVVQQRSAATRTVEHPGNVVLSLITALARTGDESERLLPLLSAIMDRVRAAARPTDWTAVQAVASVASSVTDETPRWHLDVLAGRLLLLRPSTGRQAWAG
jgi:hypothetical protein